MKVVTQLFSLLFAFALFLTPLVQTHAAESLKVVPTQKVCMVTNAVFPNDQIPVKVGAKTYYGCCEGCKTTLSTDPSSRTAKDPLSGKSVDKASAVIAARADGTVLYFENEKNVKAYEKNLGGK